jgi:uncharacterized protein YecE (DUF72 family)
MLRVGVAGWDYPDWQGVVYPPGLKGTERLSFLAGLFGVVEINVTFYRPVAAKITERWLEAVLAHADFRFTAKLWSLFTHGRRLAAAELAQFPYSFHHTEENRAYLVMLKEALQGFPLAVEVRHRSWQRREVQEFLAEAGLDFVNIDQPMVSYPMGATRWVTGARGYLRCHGRRKESWFEFGEDRAARYDYLYSPEELEDLVARVRELEEKAPEVYVIFNNHPGGQAVANGLDLSYLLMGRKFPLPPCLLAAFPRLRAIEK